MRTEAILREVERTLGPWMGPYAAKLVKILLKYLPGFVLVAATALAVDMSVIAALGFAGVAVEKAVVAGYLVGNVVCYYLLCRFVYGRAWNDIKRYGRFFVGNMTGLLVRVSSAAALVGMGLVENSALVVIVAVGLSFSTNYLVTTLWAIRPIK